MAVRGVVVLGLALAIAAALAPAAADAAGLIAAYDRYETGKGFEIGLVNVSTGATVPVPAAVNTTDDELHPALSADGRYLVFTRMKLQPKLNGDIVPPAQRAIHWLDRQTGQITQVNGGAGGAGPVFTSKTSVSSALTWGIPPEQTTAPFAEGALNVARTAGLATKPPVGGAAIRATVPLNKLHVPHAASITGLFSEPIFTPGCQPCTAGRDARYLSLANHDPNTGALERSIARLSLFGQRGGASNNAFTTNNVLEFGAPGSPGGHPVPRSGDGYVALDLASGDDVDIQSITYPGETQLTPAPSPITTGDPERMPAWSPDGIQLGFVRTTAGQRKLGVFDATPGIQNSLNAPIDIGPDAPTPQTRVFQSTWGGLSLALSSSLDVPTVSCIRLCLSVLVNSNLLQPISLQPRLSSTKKGQTVGIFVARVTGKPRKLLGRRVPRIRVVGRVPLGRTRKGVNRFSWDGRVEGRRLKRGTYLLTYRALRKKRILSISGSIRLKVTKSGKIVNVRRQR